MSSTTMDPDTQVHGLCYPQDFLASLPILSNRPPPHTPIYTLTGAQFVNIQHAYNLEDVDDSILFPFLHGLEGDNLAQNLFFSHARAREGLPPHISVPRYRGLVSVACPAEDDEGVGNFEVDSSSSSDSELDQLMYEDDGPTPVYNFTENGWGHGRQHASSISSTASSSSPLSASTTATSLWSDSPNIDGRSCPPSETNNTPPPPTRPRSPSHRLVSSISLQEVLSPTESVFINPTIPDGISLYVPPQPVADLPLADHPSQSIVATLAHKWYAISWDGINN